MTANRLASCVMACLVGTSGVALVQAELPAGWEALPAEEFATVAEDVLSATPSPIDVEDLTTHAWQAFLNDETFVATGDWDALVTLLDLFVPRRDLLTTAGTSAEEVADNLATLKGRLTDRTTNESGLVSEQSFGRLDSLAGVLRTTGFTLVEQAALYAVWMDSNDWRSLSWAEKVDLFEGVRGDLVQLGDMAVRWTGSITAPTTGEFQFQVLKQHIRNPHFRLFIGETLVLDSDDADTVDDEAPSDAFLSSEVGLVAGEPTPIRLELVNSVEDTAGEAGEPLYSNGTPAAVLFWKPTDGERAIVPPSALSPPSGFGEDGERGLEGEYFAGADLNAGPPIAERLDPNLEFVWTWGPVVSSQPEECDQITSEFAAAFTDDALLSGMPLEEKALFLEDSVVNMVSRLPLTDRRRLVQELTARPDMLGLLEPYSMGRLMQSIYMLPENEHLDLLGLWAEVRPQPRTEPGRLHVRHPDPYSRNWEHYWHIGVYLQGPYFKDAVTLWDDFLERENGECNLAIAYATTFSTNEHRGDEKESPGKQIRSRLDGHLENDEMSGDARVTWLIARSFVEEATVFGEPRLLRGLPYLEEAMLVADSNDYRFWALQEIAVRYASLGATDQLAELLDRHRDSFSEAEQQAEMDAWTTKAAEMADYAVDRRQARRARAHELYLAELQRRLAQAESRNDAAAAERLEALIGAEGESIEP